MRLTNLWLLLILLGMISCSLALHGVCTARKGNRRLRVCCNGYKKVGNGCKPLCSQGCENGSCIRPEVCACKPGYDKQNNYRCIPHCNKCTGGTCIAPNVCKCSTGYALNATGVCEPVLTTTLLANSFDKDDDSDDDFGDSGKGRGEAKYRCNHRCIHGTCHGDSCVCNEGYEQQSQEGKNICVAMIPARTGVLKYFN
uniref:Multiple epidermal growth factor-like domains protein 11 n=1 Tax=Bactrocera dorsalis TaxID=27457 RepID=A0A034WCB7_BACDO